MATSLPTWDQRRQNLLVNLIYLVHDLDHDKVPYVSTDIRYVYVHFYRGKRELGDLALSTALMSLTEDTFYWYECGKKNRRGERGDLDLRRATELRLQSH